MFRQDEEKRYYCGRAEFELRLANQAAHPDARKAHYMLAGFYLDRAYGDGLGGPHQPRRRISFIR